MLEWELRVIYLFAKSLQKFGISVLVTLPTQVETNTSVNGVITKRTDKAPILLRMEANTSVSSRMTKGMGEASTFGQHRTKVRGKNM